MSTGTDIVAFIAPRKHKAGRVVELLKNLAVKVREHEPGALRYTIHQEQHPVGDAEEVDIVMVEHFCDDEAIRIHNETDWFKEFVKALEDEDLLRAGLNIKTVRQVGGFLSK